MKRKGWGCDERSCLLVCSGGRGRDLILCLFRFPDPKGNKRKQSPPHKRGRKEDGAARFPRAQIREIVFGSAVATVRFNLLAIQKPRFPVLRLFVCSFPSAHATEIGGAVASHFCCIGGGFTECLRKYHQSLVPLR